MTSIWFLLSTVSLLWTTVNSQDMSQQSKDIYNRQLKAVSDILWKTFEAEISYGANALLLTVPSLMDVVYVIYKSMDEASKQEVRRVLPLLEASESSLTAATAYELTRALSYEVRLKTIFYGNAEAVSRRMSYLFQFATLVLPTSGFDPAVDYTEDLPSFNRVSCLGRYCPIRQILSSQPPFAFVTLANLKINSLAGFQWLAEISFARSETSSARAIAARGYTTYDYAEFRYPMLNGCAGRVLRFPYRRNLNLFFVIPSTEMMCSTSEDLWMNVQNVSLNSLQFVRRTMFVSIPLFVASVQIDWRLKLRGTPFAKAFDQASSIMYNASAFQTAEVIFDPYEVQVTQNIPMPPTSGGIPTFLAERPFFFALYHNLSPQPIVAGLINNPWCGYSCG